MLLIKFCIFVHFVMNMKHKLLLIFYCIVYSFSYAQSDSVKKQPFSLNADLASGFVWRGVELSRVPSIQPYFSFEKKGLEIAVWSTCAINGSYSEVDPYLKYSFGKFYVSITDNFTLPDTGSWKYFEYRKKYTGHAFEGAISFTGTEKFPLKLSANVFFYGGDLDEEDKQIYSSYYEAVYGFKNVDMFCGVAVNNRRYQENVAVANVGFRLNKTVEITDKISLPCNIALIVNPAEKKAFIVASITF